MTTSAWTEDRIGRLKTLWREGRSAEQIARELAHGITRSAVLGKVYRLGLSAGRSRRAAGVTVAKLASMAPPAGTARRRAPTRPPEAPVALEPGLATVLSVGRGQCRWPCGEPGAAEFSLCGRAVERGAFCGAHAAVAYRRATDTARSLERLARQT